jgi:hypothetical protein
MSLSVTSSVAGAGYTIGVGTTCGAAAAGCQFVQAGAAPIAITVSPGVYYVVLEGYEDAQGTLSVAFSQPPPPAPPSPPFAACCTAQEYFAGLEDGGLQPGAFGPGVQLGPMVGALSPFWLAKQTLMVVTDLPTRQAGAPQIGSWVVQDACGNTSLLSGSCDLRGNVSVQIEPPGIYYFQTSYASSNCPVGLSFEDVPPPPTNTTCESATPLVLGTSFTESRMMNNGLRFYSFTTTGVGVTLTATMLSDAGSATASLQGACGDAASTIGTLPATYDAPTSFCTPGLNATPACLGMVQSKSFPGLPPGNYVVSVSATAGTVFQILAQ